jgi:hypothetical protein
MKNLIRSILSGALLGAGLGAVVIILLLNPMVNPAAADDLEQDREALDSAAGELKSYSLFGVWLTEGVGNSMEPTLSEGDRALCIAHLEPAVGAVVAVDGNATGSSHDVRHRIVAMNATHITTKGDGNDLEDDPVPRDALKCVVIWGEGAGFNP